MSLADIHRWGDWGTEEQGDFICLSPSSLPFQELFLLPNSWRAAKGSSCLILSVVCGVGLFFFFFHCGTDFKNTSWRQTFEQGRGTYLSSKSCGSLFPEAILCLRIRVCSAASAGVSWAQSQMAKAEKSTRVTDSCPSGLFCVQFTSFLLASWPRVCGQALWLFVVVFLSLAACIYYFALWKQLFLSAEFLY